MSWKIARASVAGTSHIEVGLDCQDSCFVDAMRSKTGDDVLVAIVADGAGSAAAGGEGAELAVECCARSIGEFLASSEPAAMAESVVRSWVELAQVGLHQRAVRSNLLPKDFACTLLGAVVSPRKAAFFQIGDGAIVTTTGQALGVVFWPESGEYVNMTHFLTGDDAMERLRLQMIDFPVRDIAVFSDGIQRLALSVQSQTPYAPFFAPLFSFLRSSGRESSDQLDGELLRFLSSPEVNQRTDDDKTLVLASSL